MSVFLLEATDPEAWLLAGDDSDQMKAAVYRLLKSGVVIAEEQLICEAQQQCLQLVAHAERRREVMQLLERVRVSRSGPGVCVIRADAALADQQDQASMPPMLPLQNLAVSSQLIESLELRTLAVRNRETIDQYFTRVLKPLAATAHSVTLFDRYAGRNFLKDQLDALPWLLRRLLESGVPRITFMTQATEREDLIQSILSDRLCGLATSKGARLEVLVVPESRRIFHDRHLRFIYGTRQESIALGLGLGVAAFNQRSGLMDMGVQISAEDQSSARKREHDFRPLAVRIQVAA